MKQSRSAFEIRDCFASLAMTGRSFNLKFHRFETLFHREIKSENEGNTARMLVEYVAM